MKVTVEEIVTDWIDRHIRERPDLLENREALIETATQKLEEDNFQQLLDERVISEGKIAMRQLIDARCGEMLK
jgi:hypothetical protein